MTVLEYSHADGLCICEARRYFWTVDEYESAKASLAELTEHT